MQQDNDAKQSCWVYKHYLERKVPAAILSYFRSLTRFELHQGGVRDTDQQNDADLSGSYCIILCLNVLKSTVLAQKHTHITETLFVVWIKYCVRANLNTIWNAHLQKGLLMFRNNKWSRSYHTEISIRFIIF